ALEPFHHARRIESTTARVLPACTAFLAVCPLARIRPAIARFAAAAVLDGRRAGRWLARRGGGSRRGRRTRRRLWYTTARRRRILSAVASAPHPPTGGLRFRRHLLVQRRKGVRRRTEAQRRVRDSQDVAPSGDLDLYVCRHARLEL